MEYDRNDTVLTFAACVDMYYAVNGIGGCFLEKEAVCNIRRRVSGA